MKKVKRILAILMAMVMVLAMSVTAFAKIPGTDNKYGTEDDRGTITVLGVDDTGSSLSAVAYQIVKANYNNGGSFSGYEALYTTSTPINVAPENGTVDITEDQLAEIMKTDKVVNTTYPMTKNGSTFTAADVPVGSYLVVIQNAETKIYSPVVVSVNYVNKDGGNDLSDGSVTVNDGNAWVKVRENPVLDKKITGSDKKDKGNTVNIGDTVSYELTTTIPYYGGNHPQFEIHDILTGLTYKDGLTVKAGDVTLTKGSDYTVADSITNDFTINFVVNNAYTLNAYQGQTLTITYNATVNDDAAINEDPNTNTATLTYSKDSTQEGKDGESESKTKTYTFDIDAAVEGSVTSSILTKVGETVVNGEKQPLDGAEFTLYTDETCTTMYRNPVFGGTVTSANGGQLPIKGLKAGTYYLKETSAPDGYSLLDTVYTITIDAVVADSGDLTSWTIKINGATIAGSSHEVTSTFTVDNGTVNATTKTEVEIPNTKLSSLPSTGGIGTYIFTIAGILIMAAAAGFFFANRRKAK